MESKDLSNNFKINKQFQNSYLERKQKEKAKEYAEKFGEMNSETSSLSVDEERVLGSDEEVKEFLEAYQEIKESRGNIKEKEKLF